jgi:hypothetical protein
MGLTLKKQQNFGTNSKDTNVHGENIYFTTGGTTVVNWKWITYPNRKIDLKQVITDYLKSVSRRVFNQKNGILYVLVGFDENKNIVVLPSISYNKTTTGDIKSFENLGGVLPLALVKLQQDGSDGLTGILDIRPEDLEVYTGWGNFTIAGSQGHTGPKGGVGYNGIPGDIGDIGTVGPQGSLGYKGITGIAVAGDAGYQGPSGYTVPAYMVERAPEPLVDFTGTPLIGEAPLTVVFTNLTAPVNAVESWLWNFGDGSTSTSDNPSHTYTSDGKYTVTLTAVTVDGEISEIKVEYIEVTSGEWIQDHVNNIDYENWQTTLDTNDSNIQNITEFPG